MGIWIDKFVHVHLKGLSRYFLLLIIVGLLVATALNALAQSTGSPMVESIEFYADTTCTLSPEKAIGQFSKSDMILRKQSFWVQEDVCYWSKVVLSNNDVQSHIRYLYFPQGRHSVTYYLANSIGSFDTIAASPQTGNDVLRVEIQAGEKSALFIQYSKGMRAVSSTLRVSEVSESEYMIRYSRVKYKYLFYGFIAFPLLFFLAQFIVERDYLNFYYLIFLIGSSLNLITILESIPFFELSPRFILKVETLQKMFLFSILLILTGLVKYIHTLLNIRSRSDRIINAGHLLLALLLIIILVPLFFPSLFMAQHYESYLQYFRTCSLAIFLYILLLCIHSIAVKIRYSQVLLLAFLPFILSAIYYATTFIVNKGYSGSSSESFVVIGGFFLTVLLFGVILGVRNKAIKADKIMLEEQTRNLQELDHFKSRFYTNFTHEFRTPLTVISGTAELIKNNEKQKQLIKRNSKRLLNTVNELLELSRLESETIKINWIKGDIVSYLKYLIESCSSLAESKQLQLSFDSKNAELVMDYDTSKLQKIVINLLSNAIKFTPEGGKVGMTVEEVSENESRQVSIAISDTGIGISTNQLPKIFDRFYQVDESDTRAEGTGIGLALAKELTQTLGGSLEVESEFEKGSTFYLTLPIHQHAIEISEFNPPKVIGTSLPTHVTGDISDHVNSKGQPMVLVIEDNPDVTTYIFDCLDSKYALLSASDGRKGIEKAFEIIPDVIICDVMMPELDGFEVCKRLKADRRTSHIPILILTAKSTQEDKITGLSYGADAYITKPFDQKELLIRLSNLSEISQRLRANVRDSLDQGLLKQIKDEREAQFILELDHIIAENLQDETFETNKLCKAIGMSRTQLHRKLSAVAGTSTARYIRWYRMREARKLLETTDHSVGEIVVKVGYKTFSHFSSTFAEHFGCPPSKIREE